MIDKLEVRIPRRLRLTEGVQVLLGHGDSMSVRSRPTKRYRRVTDLRLHGFSSILHYQNRLNGDHKLELQAVGDMALSRMMFEIKRVVDSDPTRLEIMRVDLAADDTHHSVQWFRHNLDMPRKRYTKEIVVNGEIETYYIGQRPNLIRIYNKLAEIWATRRKARRLRWATGAALKPMRRDFGTNVLTRVERQYGGGRVPPEIDSLQKLHSNAADFNPFEDLRIRPMSGWKAILDEYRGITFLKACAFARLIEQHGLVQAKRILEQKTGNGWRIRKQLDTLVSGIFGSEEPNLYEEYRRSVVQQLAGEGRWAN